MTETNYKATPDENKSPKAAAQVHDMFSAIAHRYDLLNRLLSFGIDSLWRRQAVRTVKNSQAERILDVATGTADLALQLKRRLPDAEVVGVDFVDAMLERGREKAQQQTLDIRLEHGDGTDLPYADLSFDAVTIAYGIRNFNDRKKGFEEFYRVLKPEGILVVLEFPPPPSNLFGRLFRLYFLHICPIVAGFFSGQRNAYSYLAKSVIEFPQPERLAVMIKDAGFADVRYHLQTFGVSAMHVAKK